VLRFYVLYEYMSMSDCQMIISKADINCPALYRV